MTTYVYGASDDLIEIEGSLTEEFYAPTGRVSEGGPYYLGFSDGTLLKITYDGDWNIKVIEGQVNVIPAGHVVSYLADSDWENLSVFDVPDHSDLAIIHSDVTWVVGGTDAVK